MINFNFAKDCCGCASCLNICKSNAIQMISDNAGFLYPYVDNSKCTSCGLCEKVCPHLNTPKQLEAKVYYEPKTWLYSSSNEDIKKKSSSGGAFYELAKCTINIGGLVCGCVWNDMFEAEHILTDNICGIQKMQGSKYVQSNLNKCYQQVLQGLQEGKEVLFSGTPCQVTAMHNYVISFGQDLRSHLITVAVICHGISAPEVWKSYVKWLEKKHCSKLSEVNFRDKTKEGYKISYCRYAFESGEVIYIPTFLPSSKYIEASLVYNLSLRNSCAHCDCKGVIESCDIMLGDWYAEYKGEGNLGTSCIIAFTNKGEDIIRNRLFELKDFNFQKIVNDNSYIVNSAVMGKNRDVFLSKISVDIWDKVESYFPIKYKVKKLCIQLGIFDKLRIIKKMLLNN